jgi:hypothetical protein
VQQAAGARGATEQSEGVTREGVDVRQRGWFWHWNNVVTQYAPLIGLKGVGLLNSYTVWTDRRDESPHRGYAFPSQQSEADFYGEERAELITINKILVALDLIEIRKEMIYRTDERGRRWRVPHNLYRVKDRPDGVDLRASDVLRVAELAQRDSAVYRYVRRVFSPRFQPIDRDNIWHTILIELHEHPTWRELQERTAALESRASARSRAGHKTRTSKQAADPDSSRPDTDGAVITSGQLDGTASINNEQTGSRAVSAPTVVATTNNGSLEVKATDVELVNTGLGVHVATTNTASGAERPTSAAHSNTARVSSVGLSNTTYHQERTTTTTTTTRESADRVAGQANGREPSGNESPKRSTHGANVAAESAVSQRASAAHPEPSDDSDVFPADIARQYVSPLEQPTAYAVELRSGAQGDGCADPDRNRRDERQAGERADQGDEDRDSGVPGAWAPAQVIAGEGTYATNGTALTGSALASDEASRVTPAEHLEVQGGASGERSDRARVSGSTGVRRLADSAAGGPLGDPGALVISLFEAANDRASTPLERILLAELERDADPAARAVGVSGADWVAAALREAVASGSAFVAPKRIREIITRWAHDGDWPGNTPRDLLSATPASSAPPAARSATPPPASPALETLSSPNASEPRAATHAVRLPGGASGKAIWDAALADFSRLLDQPTFERLLVGSALTRYWRGTVEIQVQSNAAAEKLATEYRPLVERQLNERLPRPVAVRFLVAESEPSAQTTPDTEDEHLPAAQPTQIVISRADAELGARIWRAILDDCAAELRAADLRALASVVPLGADAAGVMVLGTPTSLAMRLIDGRCRGCIERGMSAFLGRETLIRPVASGLWSVCGD